MPKKQNKNTPVVTIPETKEELEKVINPKHLLFSIEYVKDFNGADAYMRAGFKTKNYETAKVNASKLLANTNIKKYVELLKAEVAKDVTDKTKVDVAYVVNNLVEILERCMQIRPVIDPKTGEHLLTQTKNGELAAAYIFNAKDSISALSLLSEHLPDWKTKQDDGKDKPNNVIIELNNYMGQPMNTYFPITKETKHLAELLGIIK